MTSIERSKKITFLAKMVLVLSLTFLLVFQFTLPQTAYAIEETRVYSWGPNAAQPDIPSRIVVNGEILEIANVGQPVQADSSQTTTHYFEYSYDTQIAPNQLSSVQSIVQPTWPIDQDGYKGDIAQLSIDYTPIYNTVTKVVETELSYVVTKQDDSLFPETTKKDGYELHRVGEVEYEPVEDDSLSEVERWTGTAYYYGEFPTKELIHYNIVVHYGGELSKVITVPGEWSVSVLYRSAGQQLAPNENQGETQTIEGNQQPNPAEQQINMNANETLPSQEVQAIQSAIRTGNIPISGISEPESGANGESVFSVYVPANYAEYLNNNPSASVDFLSTNSYPADIYKALGIEQAQVYNLNTTSTGDRTYTIEENTTRIPGDLTGELTDYNYLINFNSGQGNILSFTNPTYDEPAGYTNVDTSQLASFTFVDESMKPLMGADTNLNANSNTSSNTNATPNAGSTANQSGNANASTGSSNSGNDFPIWLLLVLIACILIVAAIIILFIVRHKKAKQEEAEEAQQLYEEGYIYDEDGNIIGYDESLVPPEVMLAGGAAAGAAGMYAADSMYDSMENDMEYDSAFYGDEIIPDMEEIKPELEMPEIEAELIEFFDDGTDENQSVIAILDVDLSPIEGVPTIVYIPTPPEEFTPTEGADYYVALSDVEPAIDKDLIVLANNQLVYHGEASTQIKLDTDVFTATINDTVPDNQKIDMTQALEQYESMVKQAKEEKAAAAAMSSAAAGMTHMPGEEMLTGEGEDLFTNMDFTEDGIVDDMIDDTIIDETFNDVSVDEYSDESPYFGEMESESETFIDDIDDFGNFDDDNSMNDMGNINDIDDFENFAVSSEEFGFSEDFSERGNFDAEESFAPIVDDSEGISEFDDMNAGNESDFDTDFFGEIIDETEIMSDKTDNAEIADFQNNIDNMEDATSTDFGQNFKEEVEDNINNFATETSDMIDNIVDNAEETFEEDLDNFSDFDEFTGEPQQEFENVDNIIDEFEDNVENGIEEIVDDTESTIIMPPDNDDDQPFVTGFGDDFDADTFMNDYQENVNSGEISSVNFGEYYEENYYEEAPDDEEK